MNTKEKLMQLLELCIEKGLDYSYSNTGTATVSKLHDNKNSWKFYHIAYFFEHNEMEENLSNIEDLITKVKNYQP